MICSCNQGRNPPCHCYECEEAERPTPNDMIYDELVDVAYAAAAGFFCGFAGAVIADICTYYF